EASVAVTNVSDHKVTLNFAANARSKRFILTPRETRVLRLRQDFGERQENGATLVRLTHDGAPGSVIATGFVLNPAKGYSTTFSFFDPLNAGSNRLAGAHVRFGYPDTNEGFPQDTRFRAPLVLANVGARPLTAHVSVDYTQTTTPTSLGVAEERLNPG